MIARLFVVFVFVSVPVFGQTLTNADLDKPQVPRLTPAEAAAILAPHQYVTPVICMRCDGPYVATTGAKDPTAGPWEWPASAPLRRLDGTLVDYSLPTVYRAQPFYAITYWPPYDNHVYGNQYPQFVPQGTVVDQTLTSVSRTVLYDSHVMGAGVVRPRAHPGGRGRSRTP